jgi:hypothetical protein
MKCVIARPAHILFLKDKDLIPFGEMISKLIQ